MAYLTFLPTLFKWWYSDGINSLLEFLAAFFVHTSDFFAPIDILANLFKPWKRIIGQRGRGLQAFWESLADNFISRLIGFVMRFFLIITFVVFLFAYALFLLFSLTFWLGMPLWLILSLIFIFI